MEPGSVKNHRSASLQFPSNLLDLQAEEGTAAAVLTLSRKLEVRVCGADRNSVYLMTSH